MDLKALMTHHDIGGPGGAELVVAATAEALHNQGTEVELSSVFKYNKNNFEKWFGVDLSHVKASYLLPFRVNSFAIYVRLLVHNLMEKGLNNSEHLETLWVDMPTYDGLKTEIDKKTQRFVEYIHFPLDVMLHEDLMKEGLLFGETSYASERYGNPLMRFYYNTYLKYFKRYCRQNPFDYTEHVLANSGWTANICERLYGRKPKVLNPPISANVRVNYSPPPFQNRENRAVLLGRFTDEKRYHWVIDEVLPLIKGEIRNAEVAIVGSANNKRSMNYVALLKESARKKGFRVSTDPSAQADVRLLTNAPRDTISIIMDSSKVFMHATMNEHWGISVAEAMASGLPVVVHKSGGAWSDLSMEGEVGEGYDDTASAGKAIIDLMSNENEWAKRSAKSVARAQNLSVDNFAKEFISIIR